MIKGRKIYAHLSQYQQYWLLQQLDSEHYISNALHNYCWPTVFTPKFNTANCAVRGAVVNTAIAIVEYIFHMKMQSFKNVSSALGFIA